MFQDEAGFGRISKPRLCWVAGKERPRVPFHHIREYRYTYGAVDPHDGENFFIVAGGCNSAWTNKFFEELSKAYPDDYIILVMDNATWHKSKSLVIPENMELTYIPPYTPEMNPIEQIWAEIRKKGFANQIFHTLEDVVDRLCETVSGLTNEGVKSITGRKWIVDLLNIIV